MVGFVSGSYVVSVSIGGRGNMEFTEEQLFHMQENSFKNFHVKGFDYLCLERSPKKTEKVYFFDCDVIDLPEVVSPHNHRYSFHTTVLKGYLTDRRYLPIPWYSPSSLYDSCHRYEMFDWMTPLNGGSGFKYVKPIKLAVSERRMLKPGDQLITSAHQIHTIKVTECGTVIKLTQLEDEMPLDVPTQTFMKGKQAPSLNGLYEKFSMDELIAKINQYRK